MKDKNEAGKAFEGFEKWAAHANKKEMKKLLVGVRNARGTGSVRVLSFGRTV